jgi:hypothetical protein
MKVKARHWVNYGGRWKRAGEVFDIKDSELDGLKNYVIEIPDEGKPADVETQQTVKRTRKRKTEE